MRMKKISAGSVQEALALARKELGEDAVLLETKKNATGKGVTITFAVDEPDEQLFANDDYDNPADILPFRPEISRASTARADGPADSKGVSPGPTARDVNDLTVGSADRANAHGRAHPHTR